MGKTGGTWRISAGGGQLCRGNHDSASASQFSRRATVLFLLPPSFVLQPHGGWHAPGRLEFMSSCSPLWELIDTFCWGESALSIFLLLCSHDQASQCKTDHPAPSPLTKQPLLQSWSHSLNSSHSPVLTTHPLKQSKTNPMNLSCDFSGKRLERRQGQPSSFISGPPLTD